LNLRIACRRILSGKLARRAAACVAVALCSLFAASSTETAVANGDTRSLDLYHSHTGESIQATFRVNGAYDPAVLEKLNYFLRDWRNNDVTHMDPRLFDVVWEVYRTAEASQPIHIVSAYRSPETNAMLRARSHAVAEYSQHILGKAMDTTMPGMSMEQIREIGMRLQRGGVGYYSRENFVHLDVGNVRYWPRMSYEQLARVFPDGKSVDMAADGRTLPRYQEARAEIASRGGVATDVPQTQGGNIFGWLFGNHQQDREEEAVAAREAAPGRGAQQVAALDPASAAPAHMSRATPAAAASVASPAQGSSATSAQGATPASPSAANAARTQVAALTPQTAAAAPDKRAGADQDATAAKDKAGKAIIAALAPLPPPRPANLVAYADVPTPPSRPEELVHLTALAPQSAADAGTAGKPTPKTDAAARLALAASLPVVITRGPKDQQGLPATVLGYAATPAAAPRLHATTPGASANEDASEIVSARLDRSNYSELTSATPTAEEPPASVLGQAFTGLRQAARIIPDALSATSAGYKIAFNAAAGLLDCAHFTKGPASAPQASASGVSISEASSAKPN
jgi:uncharacterized protein YcbK (DUF882 family)